MAASNASRSERTPIADLTTGELRGRLERLKGQHGQAWASINGPYMFVFPTSEARAKVSNTPTGDAYLQQCALRCFDYKHPRLINGIREWERSSVSTNIDIGAAEQVFQKTTDWLLLYRGEISGARFAAAADPNKIFQTIGEYPHIVSSQDPSIGDSVDLFSDSFYSATPKLGIASSYACDAELELAGTVFCLLIPPGSQVISIGGLLQADLEAGLPTKVHVKANPCLSADDYLFGPGLKFVVTDREKFMDEPECPLITLRGMVTSAAEPPKQ